MLFSLAVVNDVRTWVVENSEAVKKVSGLVRELEARGALQEEKAA